MSRKSKYTPELVSEIVKIIEGGGTDKCAYESLGLSDTQFYDWIKDNSVFSETIKRARAKARVTVINKLGQKIQEGDLGAIIFWLTNRDREAWSNTKYINAVIDKGTGEVRQEVRDIIKDIDKRTPAERDKIIEQIRKLSNK